jgi:monovalent cation:proton antiporter-2 (CPA2) family protein
MTGPGLELREVVVVLVAAGLVVPLMHRFRVSPVLGFLLIGMVIGPHGLGGLGRDVPIVGLVGIHDPALIHTAGELGVMFLLFMIGLEMSIERLWRLRKWVFGLGSAQVVATAAAIATVAVALGSPAPAAIVLGACLALSSTAIVMQLLTAKGRLGTPVGQVSFAILLLQDLAVVPILFLVGVLAGGADSVFAGIVQSFGKAALAVVGILAFGRLIVRPILHLVAGTGSRELFLAVVLLAAIGTAAATQMAGLSLPLGSFLAGLLLAETEFRHRIAVDLEPFKGLLLGVFFVAVGLGIDIRAVLAEPLWLPLLALGLILMKAGVLFAVALAFGVPRAVAAETAILLGQGGEFAFIVVTLALDASLLPAATAQFILLVVGLSMAATPLLAVLARRVGEGLAAKDGSPAETFQMVDDLSGHVVIVGYGRVGRAVGALLDSQRIVHVAIDARPIRVASLRREGAVVFQGDAAQHDILARLGIERAAALVVTMDDPETARRVVATAHHDWPSLPIYARVRDDLHARELVAAGATHVTPETTEASLQLGEAVLIGAGVPNEAAREIIAEAREFGRASARD